MNIKYKVLVCDDNNRWYNSIHKRLKMAIQQATSLIPDIEYRSGLSKLDLSSLNNYDLFLIDYAFVDDASGDIVIEEIRKCKVYTNVIFYSGQEDTSKLMKRLSLEGVYCSQRNSETLLEKVKLVARISVRRFMDYDSIRGLYLAATSVFENRLSQYIKSSSNVESFASKAKKKVVNRYKQIAKKTQRGAEVLMTKQLSMGTLIDDVSFLNFNDKLVVFHDIIESSGDSKAARAVKRFLDSKPTSDNIVDYATKEYVALRNSFAHVSSEKIPIAIVEKVSSLKDADEIKGDAADILFHHLKHVVLLIDEYQKLMDEITEDM